MEPIINPWMFYLADVCNAVIQILILVATALVISVGSAIIYLANVYCNNEDREKELMERGGRYVCRMIIALAVSLTAIAVITSEKTIYKMMAASVVTPDNVTMVKEQAIDTVKEIAEAIGSVRK